MAKHLKAKFANLELTEITHETCGS